MAQFKTKKNVPSHYINSQLYLKAFTWSNYNILSLKQTHYI